MENYSKASDIDLQALAAAGDRDAEETLASRYMYLVRACARPMFLAGGDSEDLIQEGTFGLVSAIRQFSPECDASFKTFAEHCIRMRLYSAIKSASRLKHFPLKLKFFHKDSFLLFCQPAQRQRVHLLAELEVFEFHLLYWIKLYGGYRPSSCRFV